MKVGFIDTVHPLLESKLTAFGYNCVELYNVSKENIMKRHNDIEIFVVRSRFKIDAPFIDSFLQLKCIARFGAGMENIDVTYAESKNVKCVHAPEGNRVAVAEHCLAMLLCLFNNIMRSNSQVKEYKWIREANRGIELSGKTIGIIGFGNMGTAFAQVLKGFDVQVLVHDIEDKQVSKHWPANYKQVSLAELQSKAEVVSVHLPLLPSTLNYVNTVFISGFTYNFYIINSSRGKVLNTNDLYKSLKNKKVLGACLDVLDIETTSFETIEPTQEFSNLVTLPNVIVTPHIAGWSHQSNEKMANILYEKIRVL
jgi:D-3-phosphoglycerate dehydrogenase / 2-oxoglutarate reductase